jgi:hypothetical protein
MPGLDDYGALLRSGAASVPDYAAQEAQRQMQALQITNAKQQLLKQQQALQEQQSFQNDLTSVLANPSPTAYSTLALKHPAHAEQVKTSFEMQDKAKRDSDLRSMVDIYAPAQAGKYDLAASLLQRRIDGDKAAGQDTGHDQMMLDALNSGDPTQQKAAVGMMGYTLAAITGDKFNETLGALNKDKGYTLAPGDVRFDENNNKVAGVDAKPDFLVVPEGGKAIPLNPAASAVGTGGGDPASSGAGVAIPPSATPAVKAVASTLASSGLPAPVVAGFLGNFHAEGGYDGAQGDGGSASGIAQWHSDRAANFQRVIGKSVTEATPTEQAQFVVWEMQHPEAAGMTVEQRDAILNAKTPAQAAALIDQHYERSSGQDRHVRMAAANAFAGGAIPTVQPGDVPGTVYGNPKPQARTLTPTEAAARGLSPAKVYEQRPDGTVSAIGDAAPETAPGDANLSGPAYIASLSKTNPSLANQVQGVLDTRLAYPPATARSPQAQALRAAVLQADPSYDEQAYKRRQTTIQQYTPGHAGPGQSMLSAATLINHMYDLAQAARNLPDHSTAAQNAVSSWFAKQTNEPWLIKYNEGRKFVASELPKFLEGKAPTEGQVHEHYDSYSPSKGKTGIQNALSTDVDYLYGRYQPLIQAYKDSTGKDLNIDTYAPGQATKAKAAALEYYRANGALPVVVTSAAQAAKLPHGAVFATPDGRVLRRH